MADYALTASVISRFIGRDCPDAGDVAIDYWGELLDGVGPALPFVVGKDWLSRIPSADLGLPDQGRSDFAAQPGEMWVLFCFRKVLRESASPRSVVRAVGFPLVLEWRKGVGDSPLLSGALRGLAALVRGQLKATDWGLHPAYGRYGDKVDFTDPLLFADQEDQTPVSSAYGALLSGLYCAVRGKFPPDWTFPTLQWDAGIRGVSGVAGLSEKIVIAAECGAKCVTVASAQRKEAEKVVRSLRSTDAHRFRNLSLVGVGNCASPEKLASRIAFSPSRRKRLLKGAAFGLAIAFAMGGLFAFDVTRRTSLYYAAYVDHYGLPEGLYEMPFGQVRNRVQSFRFDYAGVHWGNEGRSIHRPWQIKSWFGLPRRLKRMVCVNSRNAPVAAIRDDLPGVEMPPILEFDYSLNSGNVSLVKCRKRGGTDLVSGAVTKVLEFQSLGNGGVNDLVDLKMFNSPYYYFVPKEATGEGPLGDNGWAERSSICRYILVRDALGRVSRKFFADAQGYGVIDGKGIGGLEYEYAEDGLTRQVRFLGKFEKGENPATVPYVMDGGGVSIRRFRHVRGDLVEFTSHDAMTNLVFGAHGAAKELSRLDAFGNVVSLRLMDDKLQPVNSIIGGQLSYAEVDMAVEDGLHTSFKYRIVDERGGGVTARVLKESHDDLGDPLQRSWHDADGEPTSSGSGHPYERIWCDRELGLPVEIRYYGKDGKTPVYSNIGGSRAAGQSIRYDDTGNESELCYVDGEGRPLRNKENWVFKRCRYEGQNLTDVDYYDELSNLVCCVEGYAHAKLLYKFGNLQSIEFFKSNEAGGLKPAENHHGVHKYEWLYDERGRRVCEFYSDGEGNACKSAHCGCYGQKCIYSPLPRGYRYGFNGSKLPDGGEECRILNLDKDRETPFRAANGYVELRSVYDEQHNLVFESMHDAKGELISEKGCSVAAYEYAYDKFRRRKEMTCWDKCGKPCVDDRKAGVVNLAHKKVAEYYPRGLVREYGYYDREGGPTRQNGYHKERFAYDVCGRVTATSYWGCDNEPTCCDQGYHLKIDAYTDSGELEETAHYGVGGTNDPVVSSDCAAWKVRYDFDQNGNLERMSRYGADRKLLSVGSSAAYFKPRYDELNRLVETSFFTSQDRPTVNGANAARIVYEYKGYSMQVSKERHFADEASPLGPYFLPGVAEISVSYGSDSGLPVETRLKDGAMPAKRSISIIGAVLPGGVADKKGLKLGDVVLAVNGFAESFDYDYTKLLPRMKSETKRMWVARWTPMGYRLLSFDFAPGKIGTMCVSGVKIPKRYFQELVSIRNCINRW